jgi:hypothetical protein
MYADKFAIGRIGSTESRSIGKMEMKAKIWCGVR